MKPPDTLDEGLELISRLFDGTLTDAGFDRLHLLLEEDGDLRKIYLQTVDQEVEFSCRGTEVSSGIALFSPVPERYRLAAAALVLGTLCLLFWIWQPERGEGETPLVETGPSTPVEEAGNGEGMVVPAPVPVRPRPVPPAAESWAVDFEEGLPIGWAAEFVAEGLPPGSRGAAASLTKEENGVVYQSITPPMSWAPGHFRIRGNTHLHLTIKVDRAAYFEIFMLTHVPDPDRPEQGMYRFSDPILWEAVGEWRRFTIPLSAFSRKDRRLDAFVGGIGPEPEEVAWQLFISSANTDLRLVVDALRVDDEGTGEVTVERLE